MFTISPSTRKCLFQSENLGEISLLAKIAAFYHQFSLFAQICTLSSWAHFKVGTFHYKLQQQFSAEICGFGCCWGVTNLNFGKN